ncbi:MAG: FHIPEP family type III secretion protein, partial [Alphaproteobacteria bacterium]|nr:FHIPEP family type III secretion protein [Alphaproteobacteria bacterium]
MAEPAAAEAPPPDTGGAAQGPTLMDRLNGLGRQTDIMLALGVFGIVLVLLIPLPTWLLDIFLALSITFSALILLVSLFIHRPLDFSPFPTVRFILPVIPLALDPRTTQFTTNLGHQT